MASHVCQIRNGMTSSNEADLSNIAVAFINSAGGVVATNDYAVYPNNHVPGPDSPNMSVQVNLGRGYVPNLSASPPMMYSSFLDTATSGTGTSPTNNVTIRANTTGSTQQDYIVLYVNKSASPDAAADNVMAFASPRGTGGSAPTNSQILSGNGLDWAGIGALNPYIILAQVAVVNNATSISSGNITDKRTFATFITGQTVPVALYEDFTDQASAPSAPAAGITRVFTKGSAMYSLVNGGSPAQVGGTTLVANGNSGTAFTIDWSKGNTQSITLTGNCTFTFSNPTPGTHLTLIAIQDGTGSRTATWPAAVIWPNNTAPTLTTTLSNSDMVGFIWDGTYYRGFVSLGYPH